MIKQNPSYPHIHFCTECGQDDRNNGRQEILHESSCPASAQKPVLPWIAEPSTPSGRYHEAALFDCLLFTNPHGWDVYYAAKNALVQERHGRFPDKPLPSVDECKVQAEAAARELLQPLKDSALFEAWAALWGLAS